MNLVIDANVIFATLIKNSKSVDIILNKEIIIYAPEFFLEELDKYKELIIQKTHRTKESLEEILNILRNIIIIISHETTEKYIQEAKSICPDEKDVDYFALALKLKCPIWSNDKKLKEQDEIKIYSTSDLIDEFEMNL